MKLLLDIKDDKAVFIIELLKNFKFVKAKPLTEESSKILEGIKTAVGEMKLIQKEKIEGKPAEKLLDEL